jgi:hypothetical protein
MIVATRRQTQANMTNAIHRYFDQFEKVDSDEENENVFPRVIGGFC